MTVFNSSIQKFHTVLLLLSTVICVSLHAQGNGKGRLIIIGCPDSAVVNINDTLAEHDMSGWYEIPSGVVKVEIIRGDSIIISRGLEIKAGQDHRIQFECLINCAQVRLTSKPSGAAIDFDGTDNGLTPYLSDYVPPGKHTLTLSSPGYAPLVDTFTLNTGKLWSNVYTLERSQSYKDSVKRVQMKEKRARQRTFKILFASLSGIMLGSSAYFDRAAHTDLERAKTASDSYDGARDNFSRYKQTYSESRENAKSNITKRNALLGAAGACLIGFGLSFVF